MRSHLALVVFLCSLSAACSDGTGPSDGANHGTWSEASGRYRLTYMSGAQPPWRYVDPGGSISADVDSAMMRLHPDGRYEMAFYLSAGTARPTFRGYWSPTGSHLTFMYLPHGKGGMTTGEASDDELTINPVPPLMPGIQFPNGSQTEFDFKRAGSDREAVDSFVQSRLLAGLELTGVTVSASDMVLAVAPAERKLIRSSLPFEMPAPAADGGAQPLDIAIAQGGTEAFVAEGDGSELGIYDVATGTRTGSVKLRATVLRVLARGNAIFALTGDPFGVDSLFRVDATTHAVTAGASVWADAIAVSEDGARVYAGSGAAGVQEFDGATLDSLRTFDIPASGGAMALSQDGATLYVGHDGNSVQAWDLATATQTLDIPIAGDIYDLARRPHTEELYVSRSQATGAGSVYRINPMDPSDQSEYNTGGLPRRIAFTSAGTPLVANGFGWIDMLR